MGGLNRLNHAPGQKDIFGIDCVNAVSGIAGSLGVRYRSLGILLPQGLWASLAITTS